MSRTKSAMKEEMAAAWKAEKQAKIEAAIAYKQHLRDEVRKAENGERRSARIAAKAPVYYEEPRESEFLDYRVIAHKAAATRANTLKTCNRLATAVHMELMCLDLNHELNYDITRASIQGVFRNWLSNFCRTYYCKQVLALPPGDMNTIDWLKQYPGLRNDLLKYTRVNQYNWANKKGIFA